ncbi:MAG: hypothetical protein E7165_04410 [Firmicutes bacterium]|nr:hypothetical protein [Bacillota bacterium]
MKYSIEGIENSKVIQTVQSVSGPNGKYFFIDYLDGTQDIIEFNETTLRNVITIMESQAERYVKNKQRKISNIKIKQITLSTLGSLGSIAAPFIAMNPATVVLGCLVGGASLFTIITANVSAKTRINDIEKYDIYLNDIKNKLNDYNRIIAQERDLAPELVKSIRIKDIRGLDGISLKEAKNIGAKVERYMETAPTSPTPKKKTLRRL